MKQCPECLKTTENDHWEYCRPCKNERSEFIRMKTQRITTGNSKTVSCMFGGVKVHYRAVFLDDKEVYKVCPISSDSAGIEEIERKVKELQKQIIDGKL